MLAAGALLASLLGPALVYGAFDVGYGNDDDLSRSLLFEVAIYEPEEVIPGYWFIAPYARITQEKHPNQNTCDFRVFEANDTTFLSAILTPYHPKDPTGHAIIFDSSMQITQRHHTPNALVPFNMHEFNVIHNGKTAMHIIQKSQLMDVSHLKDNPGIKSGLVVDMGIREFDLVTGETTFKWWAGDHVNLNASTYPVRNLNGPFPNAWDWIHLNAIDKNHEGDYMITARYTDAVYKISGKDGHIMWSLGGATSSFVMDAFNFTRPHDGRFLSSDATSETITLLDNGGCEESISAETSSALIIHLDKSSEPWTATFHELTSSRHRPDDGRSEKRGNFQLLPNGNAFVGWSENSYISEHSPDGRLLMEAQFTSHRFVTYRAYKFNFTSAPSEPPVLKAFAYGESVDQSVSVYYVSWNGATDVAIWEFYDEDDALLGRAPKSGFETTFSRSSRYRDKVYAVAVSAGGVVLGKTVLEDVEYPRSWTVSDGRQEPDDRREGSMSSGEKDEL
ncbi:hypothetical protein PRZ48_003480 [Zasmidium cellare]|uniref:ASST-domain-containing protein n=1 Tax=Zasmidium cellare TaxID=395010 RepID=A0ABR0EV54_ZASCE|nr:hypothetical protein PRZ48_003480 [Zasmidium cellare]